MPVNLRLILHLLIYLLPLPLLLLSAWAYPLERWWVYLYLSISTLELLLILLFWRLRLTVVAEELLRTLFVLPVVLFLLPLGCCGAILMLRLLPAALYASIWYGERGARQLVVLLASGSAVVSLLMYYGESLTIDSILLQLVALVSTTLAAELGSRLNHIMPMGKI